MEHYLRAIERSRFPIFSVSRTHGLYVYTFTWTHLPGGRESLGGGNSFYIYKEIFPFQKLKQFFFCFLFFYFTILYWFCHTSTCIHHGCACVPHPEPLSHLFPHTIPLGHPSAPAPSFLYPASNLYWRFVSYIIHVLMPFSQIIPHSLSHRVQKAKKAHALRLRFTKIMWKWLQGCRNSEEEMPVWLSKSRQTSLGSWHSICWIWTGEEDKKGTT